MSHIWHDSFDFVNPSNLFVALGEVMARYELSGTDGQNNNNWWGAGNGRNATGGSSGGINPYNSAFLQKQFTARPLVFAGIAARCTNTAIANRILEVRDGATIQCYLDVVAGGQIRLVRGDGTVLATSSGSAVLPTNIWVSVELMLLPHNTAGAFEVRVNETTWMSGAGVNTRSSAANQATAVRLTSNAGNGSFQYDDFYICDDQGATCNSFYGNYFVEALTVTGPGAVTEWTPNGAAADWQCVKEKSPNDGDTTYVSTTTPGATDTYAMADLAYSGGAVRVMTVMTVGRRDDALLRQAAAVVRSNGANYSGPAIDLGAAYARSITPFETDPDTSAAWTPAAIDAAEIGVKMIS